MVVFGKKKKTVGRRAREKHQQSFPPAVTDVRWNSLYLSILYVLWVLVAKCKNNHHISTQLLPFLCHPPLFIPSSPSPPTLSRSGALLMCWKKLKATPPPPHPPLKKRGPFLCVLVLLEVIKKGFVLGGLGLLSLRLIYHPEPVCWGALLLL